MADIKNVISRRHKKYTDYVNYWKFLYLSYKGGIEYKKEAKYLVRFNREPEDIYQKRLQLAVYYNYCQPLVDLYTAYIYRERKAIKREIEGIEDEIIEDIDLMGRGINEFGMRLATLSSIYGHIGIVIDMPRVEEEVITEAEKKEYRIRPYARIITPERILDWSVDYRNEFNWILIDESYIDKSNPFKPDEKINRYKLWTRTGWYVIESRGEKDNPIEAKIVEEGEHNLGIVPVVICFHQDIDEDLIGESLIKDIAYINNKIYNELSELHFNLRNGSFTQLFYPTVDGKLPPGLIEQFSRSFIIPFQDNINHAPYFASPDLQAIERYIETIRMDIEQIYRIANIKMSEAIRVPESGIAKAYDFLNTNVTLSRKAKYLESTEEKIFKIMGLWNGKEIEVNIKYPERFDVRSLEEKIKEKFDIISLNISGKLNKYLKESIAKDIMREEGEEGSDIEEEIIKEIEESNNKELVM